MSSLKVYLCLILSIFALTFSQIAASAQTTWTNGSGDGTWENPANWSSGVPSTGLTAILPSGPSSTISLAVNDNVNTLEINSPGYILNIPPVGMQFGTLTLVNGTTGSSSATFNLNANSVLTLEAGTAGSSTYNMTPLPAGDQAALVFEGTSTAGSATILDQIQTANNTAEVSFNGNSSAGTSHITNSSVAGTVGGAIAVFDDNSTAGQSTIINTGQNGGTSFLNNSTAGNANIDTSNSASVQFTGNATGGSATFTNHDHGVIFFGNTSTAGNATINNNGSVAGNDTAQVSFFQNASAGSSIINNTNSGALLIFQDNSTAATSTITNNGGAIQLDNNSTGGNADILDTNHGFTFFLGTSSAGNASITNDSGGTVRIQANATAANSTITNNNGGTASFLESGTAANSTIVNNQGGDTNFEDSSTAGNAAITNNASGETDFRNTSTAANANVTNTGASALTEFFDTATAGNGIFHNTNGGNTMFSLTSTAGNATFTDDTSGRSFFQDSATGGNAAITNNTGGSTVFIDTSTAGESTLTNNGGAISFFSTATAGSSSITNNFTGSTGFFESSSAGTSAITNNAGSSTNFNDSSTAANAVITSTGSGAIIFNNTSTAGSAAITSTNNGIAIFNDTSSAGSSTIENTSGGGALFSANSSAGTSAITNTGSGSETSFAGNSTAGAATIVNTSGGRTVFDNNSSATTSNLVSHIENDPGGSTQFFGNSSAGNAAITIDSGSSIDFAGNANGTTNTVVTNNIGGLINLSGLSGTQGNPGVLTLGTVNGAGMIELGENTLQIGSTGNSDISGPIGPLSESGSVIVVGTGDVDLSGMNLYTGPTEVKSGTLTIGQSGESNAKMASSILVDPNGTLNGVGFVFANIQNDGTFQVQGLSANRDFAQGSSGNLLLAVTPNSISTLNVAGTASLDGTATFVFAPGTYTSKLYPFLQAQSVTGTFSNTVTSGSVPTGSVSLVQYSGTEASLDLITDASVIGPADDSIFSAQNSALSILTKDMTREIESESGDDGHQIWARYNDDLLPVAGHGGLDFHSHTDGILGGCDHFIGSYGLTVGYEFDGLFDSLGGTSSATDGFVGLYGQGNLGSAKLDEVLSYGSDWSTTTRQIGIGSFTSSHKGGNWGGGLEAIYPSHMSGGYKVTPQAGIIISDIDSYSFSEPQTGMLSAFAVSGRSVVETDAVLNAGLDISRKDNVGHGEIAVPDLKIGVDYSLSPYSAPDSLSANGTIFSSTHTDLDNTAMDIAAGIDFIKGKWSLGGQLSADIAGNWNSESGQIALQGKF